MIGMFDADWRTSLSLSSIVKLSRVRDPKDDQHTYEVVTDDGKTRGLSNHAYDRLVSAPTQLMPAQPGLLALSASFDGDVPYVHRTPVIAWALCVDGSIRVVTPAGVDDGHAWQEGQGYVLMPDGTVQGVGEYLDHGSFDTFEGWLAQQQEDHQARMEHQAASDRYAQAQASAEEPEA